MNNRKRKRALQIDRTVVIMAHAVPPTPPRSMDEDIKRGLDAMKRMPDTIASMEAKVVAAETLDPRTDPVKTAKIQKGREQVEIAKVRFAESQSKFASLKSKLAEGVSWLKGLGKPNEQS